MSDIVFTRNLIVFTACAGRKNSGPPNLNSAASSLNEMRRSFYDIGSKKNHIVIAEKHLLLFPANARRYNHLAVYNSTNVCHGFFVVRLCLLQTAQRGYIIRLYVYRSAIISLSAGSHSTVLSSSFFNQRESSCSRRVGTHETSRHM